MDHAKLFITGRSQAVRLPKEYRMPGKEVMVKHFGNGVLLIPVDEPWKLMEEALEEFDPDWTLEREQPPVQERDGWAE